MAEGDSTIDKITDKANAASLMSLRDVKAKDVMALSPQQRALAVTLAQYAFKLGLQDETGVLRQMNPTSNALREKVREEHDSLPKAAADAVDNSAYLVGVDDAYSNKITPLGMQMADIPGGGKKGPFR